MEPRHSEGSRALRRRSRAPRPGLPVFPRRCHSSRQPRRILGDAGDVPVTFGCSVGVEAANGFLFCPVPASEVSEAPAFHEFALDELELASERRQRKIILADLKQIGGFSRATARARS